MFYLQDLGVGKGQIAARLEQHVQQQAASLVGGVLGDFFHTETRRKVRKNNVSSYADTWFCESSPGDLIFIDSVESAFTNLLL